MPRSPKSWWERGRRSLRGRRLWLAAGGLGFGLLLLALWVVRPFWQLSGQFAGPRARGVRTGLEDQPSRLYGRPLVVAAGATLPRSEVVAELKALEYRVAPAGEALRPGSYREGKDRLEVHLRSFPTPEGIVPGAILDVTFQGRRVKGLQLGGQPVERAILEPPLLASFMGPRFLERRPVQVEELPDHLVRAVLAAEDDQFFRHGGLSASGILRAAWRNVRGGEVRQGGSTLTQQLVKNLYLTHERTLARKAQEAVLAVILELRYSKRQILQAYLNEIYLGQSGGVNLLGVGAASRAYFGEDAPLLDLGQSAILAGMIASPGDYSPLAHPERSRARRDWVLGRLRELRWAEPKAIAAAVEAPLAAGAAARRPPARALLRRRHGRRGGATLRDREARGPGVHAVLDPRLARSAEGRGGGGVGDRAAREGLAEGAAGEDPGGAGVARPAQRRDPRLPRRAQLQGEPVRPRRPGAAPGRERLQAGGLCRRLRRRRRDARHPARGRAAHRDAHQRGVDAAQRGRDVPRLGDGAAGGGGQPQHPHRAAGAPCRAAPDRGHGPPDGSDESAPAGAVARSGRLRGDARSSWRRSTPRSPTAACGRRCTA